MAHYDVTHTCGHRLRVNLVGPHSVRERKLEHMRAEPCWDCQTQALAAVAHAAAAHDNLPSLIGSPDQVRWAEQVRVDQLAAIERAFAELAEHAQPQEGASPDRVKPLVEAVRETLRAETSAAVWIDRRRDSATEIIRAATRAILQARPELDPRQPPSAPVPPAPVPSPLPTSVPVATAAPAPDVAPGIAPSVAPSVAPSTATGKRPWTSAKDLRLGITAQGDEWYAVTPYHPEAVARFKLLLGRWGTIRLSRADGSSITKNAWFFATEHRAKVRRIIAECWPPSDALVERVYRFEAASPTRTIPILDGVKLWTDWGTPKTDVGLVEILENGLTVTRERIISFTGVFVVRVRIRPPAEARWETGHVELVSEAPSPAMLARQHAEAKQAHDSTGETGSR